MRKLIGGESLVNEFRLRQELDELRIAAGAPMQRARGLLRFSRKVLEAQAQVVKLSLIFFAQGDRMRGALFGEAGRRLARMHREARNCARTALRGRPLVYGYGPVGAAYPAWDRALATATGSGQTEVLA